MNKKKLWAALLAAVLLISAATVTVLALAGKKPEAQSGEYYRKTVDRMDIALSPTHFVFDKETGGAEAFSLPLTLTLQKTEADFYCKLLGVEVEGLTPDAVTVVDETGDGPLTKDGVFLPVRDGKAVPLTLSVTVDFTAEPADALSPSLVLHYVSGLTKETADERYLAIPLQLTF